MDEFSQFQGERVKWNDPPESIRIAVEMYLRKEMACKVREKESFRLINLTSKSPNTVSHFLSAIKSFYRSITFLKVYSYANPLIDALALLNDYSCSTEGVRANKPRMPLYVANSTISPP